MCELSTAPTILFSRMVIVFRILFFNFQISKSEEIVITGTSKLARVSTYKRLGDVSSAE